MPFSPTVLYPLSLPGLLHYILTTQSETAPTNLIICSSREAFLEDLLQSQQQDQSEQQEGNLQDFVTPSLHNLFTTRHIKLAFCASVQALLARLTAYGRGGHAHITAGREKTRLVLANPLSLHAPTPSFSAQGLSRTFAAATEVALKTNTSLHVVECQVKHRTPETEDENGEDIDMSNGDDANHVNTEGQEEDPWEQEVSILNVSARRFGSNSGERAWAGRTVKAKRIAARWFRFHYLDEQETRQGLG